MRPLLSLLFVLITATHVCGQDKIRFNVHYSELYATYDFLTRISDSYPENEFKTIFRASAYDTDENRTRVAAFERLRLDYAYGFDRFPAILKAGMMSRDLLERNLAVSKTINEFMDRSVGILPQEDLTALAGILGKFRVIYRSLFEANRAKLETQESSLLSYRNSGQFAAYFQTALTFYHTTWDTNLPFEICLLPSLDKGNIGARTFANVAICEASLDLEDHVAFFSVIVHEICHSIYDHQPLAMKQEVEKWFSTIDSPNSRYALLLMNEVLATALGNGYLSEQLTGKTEEGEWYGNTYISEMAKAIYPLMKEYIRGKKPLDENFVETYVEIYDTRFPQWAKELHHLFAYRYIVADSEADWAYLRRTYRYHSYSRLGAPVSASEIEKAAATPITKVFVISRDHRQTMRKLQDGFPELKTTKLNLKKEFVRVFTLADKTKLFLINRHHSTVEQLMDRWFPGKVLQQGS